jgi:hypothetical protein
MTFYLFEPRCYFIDTRFSHTYTYVCVYCIYIYIYIERERERERENLIDTEKHRIMRLGLFTFFFFLEVLGFELSDLCLLGSFPITWAKPSSPFHFSYFSDRVWCFARADLGSWSSYLWPPGGWDDMTEPPPPDLLTNMGLTNFFWPRLTFNWVSTDCLLGSWASFFYLFNNSFIVPVIFLRKNPA